jgi:hypothetical protein
VGPMPVHLIANAQCHRMVLATLFQRGERGQTIELSRVQRRNYGARRLQRELGFVELTKLPARSRHQRTPMPISPKRTASTPAEIETAYRPARLSRMSFADSLATLAYIPGSTLFPDLNALICAAKYLNGCCSSVGAPTVDSIR